jgi:hypothetical protein
MESSCDVIGISCGKREVLYISFGSTTKYPNKVSVREREREREKEREKEVFLLNLRVSC